jgi:hypothetical protein
MNARKKARLALYEAVLPGVKQRAVASADAPSDTAAR